MRKTQHPAGAVHRMVVQSEVLKANLTGDPPDRIVDVYTPAGSDGAGLPLLVDIVGFTAGGPAHTNWTAFRENVPERLDRLIGDGAMPPVVVAFPDCFTRVGGNQYINSVATGRWADFLTTELLTAVEGRFGCGGPGRRGIFGKSSGGYGAIVHALDHPDVCAGAACHSGDMAFELCYLPDMPDTLRALARGEGSIEQWWTKLESAKKGPDQAFKALNILAMAAHYDPDPGTFLGLRLPVTDDTCEIIEDRWRNWLAHDPVVKVESAAVALKSLKALYIGCGTADQFNLLYGARRLHRRLTELGVDHRYEEFDDNHTAVDYRMDVSLPYLAKALGN